MTIAGSCSASKAATGGANGIVAASPLGDIAIYAKVQTFDAFTDDSDR